VIVNRCRLIFLPRSPGRGFFVFGNIGMRHCYLVTFFVTGELIAGQWIGVFGNKVTSFFLHSVYMKNKYIYKYTYTYIGPENRVTVLPIMKPLSGNK